MAGQILTTSLDRVSVVNAARRKRRVRHRFRLYAFLMRGDPIPNGFLTRFWRNNAHPMEKRRAMADLIYLAIGVLFLVLMGVYANACSRL